LVIFGFETDNNIIGFKLKSLCNPWEPAKRRLEYKENKKYIHYHWLASSNELKAKHKLSLPIQIWNSTIAQGFIDEGGRGRGGFLRFKQVPSSSHYNQPLIILSSA
jgi:hypothetical protein